MTLDIHTLGQVFTTSHIVSDMLSLIQSTQRLVNPRFLEPSCGDGAFFENLPSPKVDIEFDRRVMSDKRVKCGDF